MAESIDSYGIVEYFGENNGYRCGYCKSSESNVSHGMWAHSLSVENYQDLIDRGWRRSGQYIYKPNMPVVCCPMYTIRCSALDFKLSKSQKKIIKRLNKFLATGERKSDKNDNSSSDADYDRGCENICEMPSEIRNRMLQADDNAKSIASLINPTVLPSGDFSEISENIGAQKLQEDKSDTEQAAGSSKFEKANYAESNSSNTSCDKFSKDVKKGVGADTSKPACKKAKLMRIERKKQKLMNQGMNKDEIEMNLFKNNKSYEKTLEDLNDDLPSNPAHRLEIRLLNTKLNEEEFNSTLEASFELYRKYQIAIHGDAPSKCSYHQYTRFLVNSPLKVKKPASWSSSLSPGYGSFHQQYWLDGSLIAVAVLDILPKCVSSVYFYYDPDYSDLSLGTYASLRETILTRSLHIENPSIEYYYMGYYIDSCPKMRYKASLKPSYLLCPETYCFVKFEECLPKIKMSKYSRLNDDKDAVDVDGIVDLDNVSILMNSIPMSYKTYKIKKSSSDDDDTDQIKEYTSLVGMKVAKKLLLYRS